MHTRRIEQIRRRWWVVLLITVLVTAAVTLPSLFAHPTYVGKTILILSSARPTESDTTMAVGYAKIFNDPATIHRLRDATYVPADATFEARTVANSPMLAIEATAGDAESAQEAATNMAGAFRDDINSVRHKGTAEALAELERELDEMVRSSPILPDAPPNPMLAPLRERIDAMRFDTTNQLMDFQERAGVTKIPPPVFSNLVLGVAGGLLLGILTALGIAMLSTRLRNSADLREKTGVEPLVEVPACGSVGQSNLREQRLRTLANIVNLQESPKSAVIALTDSRGVREARGLAEAQAKLAARQGYRTVLVYADNEASRSADGPGFNDALVDNSCVDSLLKDGGIESLKIMPSGSAVTDRYSLMTRERIGAVIDELRTCADTIVVAAPSIADETEAQPVCAAADLTILVVSSDSSRAGDVTSAVDSLADANAHLLGTVLIDATTGR